MPSAQVRYNKTYFRKYPDKRNEGRKRNYARGYQWRNSHKHWTDEEITMILEHKKTDREIGEILGRSVQAIQNKRCKVKKEL